MAPQSEFDFDQPGPGDGLEIWRQQRERTLHRLARRLGLPLGRQVEVWLKDGVKLRGRLELKESMLLLETVDERNLQLAVDRVAFRYSEVESCVRQD
jgi:hypothetical protein